MIVVGIIGGAFLGASAYGIKWAIFGAVCGAIVAMKAIADHKREDGK